MNKVYVRSYVRKQMKKPNVWKKGNTIAVLYKNRVEYYKRDKAFSLDNPDEWIMEYSTLQNQFKRIDVE